MLDKFQIFSTYIIQKDQQFLVCKHILSLPYFSCRMHEHIFVYNIAFIIKVNEMNLKFMKRNGWKEETEIEWVMSQFNIWFIYKYIISAIVSSHIN